MVFKNILFAISGIIFFISEAQGEFKYSNKTWDNSKLNLEPIVKEKIKNPNKVKLKNPFDSISFHKLSNGLNLVLAPHQNAENVRIRLNVMVGTIAEIPETYGVSHLLEHLLFSDSKLEKDMTYLEYIKENGGKINGSTGLEITSYFAHIPAKKGLWLIEQFKKMIFENKFKKDEIKKAKSTVLLEIDEPSWLADKLGFSPFAWTGNYFPEKGFWESEFNYKTKNINIDEERLSTQKLTLSQLEYHFKNYYYPSNMTLYLTGKFNRKSYLRAIEKNFGMIPKGDGLKNPEIKLTKRSGSYLRTKLNPFTHPSIIIGMKDIALPAEDAAASTVYMNYLAHRLMKELRNLKGETYTAHYSTDAYKNSGYDVVSFNTPFEEFEKNISYVEGLIEDEARNGNFSDEMIEKAKKLFIEQSYEIAESDSATLMQYAVQFYNWKKDFKTEKSPYDIVSSLKSDEVRNSLKKLYVTENTYKVLHIPYIFSKIESLFIFIFSILLSIAFYRKFLKINLNDGKIRWSKVMAMSPAMFMEILGLFVITCFVNYLIFQPFEGSVSNSQIYNNYGLWPHYIGSLMSTFVFVGMFTFSLMFYPRKLIVYGDELILKSISFWGRRINPKDIKEIYSIGAFKPLIKFKLIWKIKWRYFYTDPLFWRKGMLIELNNGKAYFLSVADVDKAIGEIKENLFPGQSSPLKFDQVNDEGSHKVEEPKKAA